MRFISSIFIIVVFHSLIFNQANCYKRKCANNIICKNQSYCKAGKYCDCSQTNFYGEDCSQSCHQSCVSCYGPLESQCLVKKSDINFDDPLYKPKDILQWLNCHQSCGETGCFRPNDQYACCHQNCNNGCFGRSSKHCCNKNCLNMCSGPGQLECCNPQKCQFCSKTSDRCFQCNSQNQFLNIRTNLCQNDQQIFGCAQRKEINKCAKCKNFMAIGYKQRFCQDCPGFCQLCNNTVSCQKCSLPTLYFNRQKLICESCKNSIQNCVTCSIDGTQCTLCQQGYHYLKQKKVCVPCGLNCIGCTQQDACPFCKPGYGIDQVSGDCKECPARCQSCLHSPHQIKCTTCFSGFSNNSQTNMLCQSCDSTYYWNQEFSTCSACKNIFLYCDRCNKDRCLQCQKDYSLIPNFNVCYDCKRIQNCLECDNFHACSKCQEGYVLTQERQCWKCDENCKKCNQQLKTCEECQHGFKLKQSNKCYIQFSANCKAHSSQLGCYQCYQGFYLNDQQQCQSCSDKIQNCKNCSINADNQLLCKECKENSYLINADQCILKNQCQEGYVKVNDQCLTCKDSNCAYCQDQFPNSCIICKQGFIYDSWNCFDESPYNCEDILFCAKCDKLNRKCASCEEGLMLQGNRCQSPCNHGYWNDSGICKKCPQNCKKCFNQRECQQCDINYKLQGSDCKESQRQYTPHNGGIGGGGGP